MQRLWYHGGWIEQKSQNESYCSDLFGNHRTSCFGIILCIVMASSARCPGLSQCLFLSDIFDGKATAANDA